MYTLINFKKVVLRPSNRPTENDMTFIAVLSAIRDQHRGWWKSIEPFFVPNQPVLKMISNLTKHQTKKYFNHDRDIPWKKKQTDFSVRSFCKSNSPTPFLVQSLLSSAKPILKGNECFIRPSIFLADKSQLLKMPFRYHWNSVWIS